MDNKTQNYLMAVCAVVEVLFFTALLALPVDDFIKITWQPDTSSYMRIAGELANHGALIASYRTLGYPAFMALGFILGGNDYAVNWIIGGQLLLNLLFTLGCWKLIERIAPTAPAGVRVALTGFFFWAGLGMALNLLSDFLASFLFGVFLYGYLFWRNGRLLLVSASALALATLVRPTFTFVPIVIFCTAFIVGRCTSKVPFPYILAYVFASLVATGISSVYQYRFQGYAGPSPVLAKNIGRTLHVIDRADGADPTRIDYERFNRRVAERAGKPYSAISPKEEEKYAVEMFMEEFKAKPWKMLSQLGLTFVKYLLAPVEAAVTKGLMIFITDPGFIRHSRFALSLLYIPIWILALWPPIGSSSRNRAYYLVVMLFLLYVVGLTAINPFQGERIRFPLLAFMMPVLAWNSQSLCKLLSGQTVAVSRQLGVK